MDSHDEDPVQILRYVQGDLNPQEMAEFSQHLQVCDECRARVEEERALSSLLEKSAPLYIARAELHARVAESLAGAIHSRNRLRSKIGGMLTPWNWHWEPRRVLVALCVVMIAFIGLGFFRSLLQEVRASEYVEAAITAHRNTLDGRLPLEIQSDTPETVTRWAGQRVSFHFQLPVPQNVPQGGSRFELAGARLVEFTRGQGVLVVYHGQDQTVSLLIAPANAAVVAGGDEVQAGSLLFHYRNREGFNVITWNNHGLAYALVSSVSGPARQSCLVCHGSLPTH
jgi:anti-sigma factor RsiW